MPHFIHTQEAKKQNLYIVSDNIFDKYTGNSFSNTKLNKYLKSNDISEIEVTGVDGGGCVSLAIDAIKQGYKVIVNTIAIGTMMERKQKSYFEKLKKMGAEFKYGGYYEL